jgi:hypothetical protein
MACKNEKTAINQERNANADSSLSQDQVRKSAVIARFGCLFFYRAEEFLGPSLHKNSPQFYEVRVSLIKPGKGQLL